jgi:acetolactate synthase small subunit
MKNQKNNIAMKTKTNIHQIARMAVAASALFLMTAFSTVSAKDKQPANNASIALASISLDMLSNDIESSVRFTAPSAADVAAEYREMEINAAYEKLDELNTEIEKEVRFEAPAVDVKREATELEVSDAMHNLDQLNSEIEKSIRFEAPAAE